MGFNTSTFTVLFITVLLMISATATAQKISAAAPSPSPTAAPAPAPHWVNLTALLSFAGPFATFLRYCEQTGAITTFQNQANDEITRQGLTIFVPTDDAFSSLEKSTLSNLTGDQLRSLLLSHAVPQYYTLADFGNLSQRNPVVTFAGGQYTLNFTDSSGLIRVNSGWADPRISSSVYSSDPVAVYEVQRVLLPVAIFGDAPPPAPAPAPAPATAEPADLAPSKGLGGPSPAFPPSTESSPSYHVNVGAVNHFALVIAVALMLLK